VDANSYARSEGITAVMLKTLSQALADKDLIDYIIREIAVN
jgi:acyl transferase domain-containing protein